MKIEDKLKSDEKVLKRINYKAYGVGEEIYITNKGIHYKAGILRRYKYIDSVDIEDAYFLITGAFGSPVGLIKVILKNNKHIGLNSRLRIPEKEGYEIVEIIKKQLKK